MSVAGAPEQQRLTALDGLRGWAALSVVVYHCLWQTFGVRFPETHNFLSALAGNGLLAVSVFLTISGYVLTVRRWHNPANPPLPYAIVRRYIRLTLPIIGAALLVWLLMTLGQTPTRAVHRIVEVKSWYSTFLRFDEDFLGAWSFALMGAYGPPPAQNYNPFLWTMVIELWGSLIIFAVSQSDRFVREGYTPLLFCAAIGLFLFPPSACFFIGATIALAERDGALVKPDRLTSFVASTALVALLIGGALVQMLNNSVMVLSILGVLVFVAVRYSEPAQRFLSLPLSQFMGRISFPLYLVQFAIIVSFSAQAIIWLNAHDALTAANAYWVAIAGVAMSLLLSLVFLPLEAGTLFLLRRLDRYRTSRLVIPAAAPVLVKGE